MTTADKGASKKRAIEVLERDEQQDADTFDRRARLPRNPKETFVRKVAHVLFTGAKSEIISARAFEDATLYLKIDIDGYPIALSLDGVRLVEGDLDEAMKNRKGLRGRYNRIKNPESFTVEELRERNLPLYWNEEWLRKELARLGTYAAIAREHGYPSATTIASFAARKFGISVKRDYDEKRQAVIEEFDSGKFTQLELARKHGVGVATVYRWLAERTPTSGRRGRAPKTPEQRERDRRAAAKAKAKAAKEKAAKEKLTA